MSSCGGADSLSALDGEALRAALTGAISQFSQHVEAINAMNVFPVPDGDTGINIYHTLQRAGAEIAQLQNPTVAEVTRRFAYGALMGARGNSGTIFSQLLKGFADPLGEAQVLTCADLALACQRAVDFAYDAVTSPVEGTILTVAREAADVLALHARADNDLCGALSALVSAAQASLRSTPERLPILKEAGVVDAGGMGLLVFLQGLAPANGAADVPLVKVSAAAASPAAASPATAPTPAPDDDYGYDVQFLMLGENQNLAQIRTDLAQMGWSLLAVGDAATVKVHIHVHNPALPIDYAIQSGATLDDIVVENMALQSQRSASQGASRALAPMQSQEPTAAFAVLAVASGKGLRAIFEELGCAAVLPGGQSANPSVQDFLDAIAGIKAASVFILPNNRNIILTARQAAENSPGRRVEVLPTSSVVQGISAMIALRSFEDSLDESHDESRDESFQGNVNDGGDAGTDAGTMRAAISEMTAAAQQVSSIEITRATRDARLHGLAIQAGDYLAIGDGQVLAAADTAEAVIKAALEQVVKAEHELATFYYGGGLPEKAARHLIERLSIHFPELELELVFGGQDLYAYLIGIE